MYYIKKEVGCAEKNPAKKIMHFVLKSSILICHPQLPLSSSNRFRTRNAYKLRGVTVNKFWVSAWSLQAFWNEQKSQEFNGIASNFKSQPFHQNGQTLKERETPIEYALNKLRNKESSVKPKSYWDVWQAGSAWELEKVKQEKKRFQRAEKKRRVSCCTLWQC